MKEIAMREGPRTSQTPPDESSGKGPRPVEGMPRRAMLRTGLAVLAGAPVVLPAAVSAQTAAQPGLLVLPHKDLAPKAYAYFKKLSKDKKAQEAFVENPTKEMMEQFLSPGHKPVSPQRISNANRFLY